MFKKTLVSSAILVGSLISTPAFALFWSDFQLDPPQHSKEIAIRSFGNWPDWIGKLNTAFPPSNC
jgi:hypothetical protein|tara:strand:+ start:260 stop:454 length:195 start_codon:yes stop_codon:yes gene_type:complete